MAGFRHIVVRRLSALAQRLPASLLIRLTGRHAFLPFYHAVSDRPLPHIRHLYPLKSSRQFEEDLDFLLRQYEPQPLSDFLACRPARKPPLLLSFDDGLRCFDEYIAPLLLRKGVPAVCFLNAAFVGNRRLFFRYQASLLLEQFRLQPALADREEVREWRRRHAPGSSSWREALLGIGYGQQAALPELAEAIGYSFRAYLEQAQPYLSEAQVRHWQQQGFEFGAHSVDHPLYCELEQAEQLRQTCESLAYVEQAFGGEYPCFSFPFTDYGLGAAFFERLQQACGPVYTFGCAGHKRDTAPRHYQRVPLEDGRLSARQIHNAELLYALLRSPFGKNTVLRS